MTNYMYYAASKYKLAFALAVAEAGPNDFYKVIDKWKAWLDKQVDENSKLDDNKIKQFLSEGNKN